MKKVLVFLVAFVACLMSVKAEISYEPRWINDKNSLYYIEDVLQVSDGLIIAGTDNDEMGIISKLDNTGKEIKTLPFDYEGNVVDLVKSNGKYYAIGCNYEKSNEIVIYEITADLTIVREKKTGYYLSGVRAIIDVIDNKLYISSGDDGVVNGVYDENNIYYDYVVVALDNFNVEKGHEEEWNYSIFSNDIKALINFNNEGNSILDIKSNDKTRALIERGSGESFIEFYDPSKDILEAWNSKDYIKVNKITGSSFYQELEITDEYVVSGGVDYNKIDFFDFEGNLVESIDLLQTLFEEENKDMYVEVININYDDNKLYISFGICDEDYASCKSGLVSYQKMYKIENGNYDNGKITAVKDHEYGGEVVTLNVNPNDGYELAGIKVTDSNGNEIKVTDNTFVMPFADVIIEGTFVPKNPETLSGVAVFSSLIVLILSAIVGIIAHRRVRELM